MTAGRVPEGRNVYSQRPPQKSPAPAGRNVWVRPGLLGNATMEMKLKEHFAPLGLGCSTTWVSINMPSLRDWTRSHTPGTAAAQTAPAPTAPSTICSGDSP